MKFDDFEQSQGHASPFIEQIDEVCDDFESAWQRGSRISIENCLRLVPEEARGELLRELLEIEVELRIQSGESVSLENYVARFPERADVVKTVLTRHTGRRRLGDYELLEQLGRGGMGVVYKARQIYLNQIAAVKILPEQYMGDSHALSRFRREMQLIGGLKHPNIVQAYNAGEAEGMHYLAMEFVAGVTLQRLIAELVSAQFEGTNAANLRRDVDAPTLPHSLPEYENVPPTEVDPDSEIGEPAPVNGDEKPDDDRTPVKAMSVGAACEAIRQAALGLHHAHQRGLVHRDIKPGNLMLERHGLIKVLDLGLGKFQADVRQSDLSMGPLTQAGTTMGTVDYMAPEQWDDPTTVDIRADIYSLGNTLYFLLCGSPPFDGKNYGSNREKLMAHIVAEPPSLRKGCPDVPPELETAYLKMAAKEADARYQTPLEVVEALEPFADADELIAYIPEEVKNISDAEHSTSSQYDNSVGRDTIASHPMTPSRRRRISELDLAPPPKPWFKRQEFYAAIALFNMVLFVIAIWLVSRLWRDDMAEQPQNGQQIVVPDDMALLRFDPAERNAIAADLVELPGLSGATWFSEMPWLTPFVRRETANALLLTNKPETVLGNNLRGYLDADTVRVQQWLWSCAETIRDKLNPPQRRLVIDLKELADSNLDGNAYAERVEVALQKYVDGKANLPHRAADSNTEAMLLHLLADLRGSKELGERARQKYQEALDAYGADTVSQQLKLLCMTDMARLLGRTLGDYETGHEMYAAVVRASDNATNLLKVEAYTDLGMELAGLGQYEDKYFRFANTLLTDPKHINIDKNHPLIAHVAERHAWSLVEQWKMAEAQQLFNEALSIRQANSRSGQNPFADIYSLHNRHGIAMTTRFLGDPDSARQEFAKIVDEVATKLAAAEKASQADPTGLLPGQLRYFRELRERLANSRYRWADCELFGGAASGASGISLTRAELLYEQARDMTNDRTTRVNLSIKLGLIRAMLGKIDEADASLKELDPVIKSILSADGRFRANQGLAVMQQVVKVRKAEIDVDANPESVEMLEQYGREIDSLRKQLQQIAEDEIVGASTGTTTAANGTLQRRYNPHRPDALEFRLFCLEFLLNAERKRLQLSGAATLSLPADMLHIGSVLAFFRDKPEMKPYIRRYYDMIIHLADKTDPSAIAVALQAKMGLPPDFRAGNDDGKAWQLLFHFTSTDNFAIFQTDDEPAVLLPLNLTRKEIEDASDMGRELEPQPELAEIFDRIREARTAGRIANIFWSDSQCWTHEKDALIDLDWPFKKRLPLRVPLQQPDALASGVEATSVPIYVGTYTGANDDAAKGVYLTRLNTADGSLAEARLVAEVPNPAFLAKHPTQPRLYAVTEQSQGTDGSPVHAFAIDPQSHGLTLLNTQFVPALGACHLGVFSFDKTATDELPSEVVMVACYHEGAVASLLIQPGGTLGPCTTVAEHHGSGPNEQRQQRAHAHAVHEWEPGIVVVPDLGTDKLFFYRLHTNGSFEPNPVFGELSIPSGSGPRHMAFSRETRTAFVLNELNSTINVVAYPPENTGDLPRIVQTLSTLPEGTATENNFPAEIVTHPNGQFLYASNRGDDSIALFHFDTQNRRLTLVETASCGGKWPRSFDISPCGQWLISAAQNSNLLTTFHINPENGLLTPTNHQITVKSPACVLPIGP